MASIYIHIPFCRQACHYCDFHFSTSLKSKDAFLNALLKEIKLQQNYLSGPIQTVYFGGGTPSLLSGDELKRIFDELDKNFKIAQNAEITLEANPDDLNKEKLDQLKGTPINRLSIGIQSFFDNDLRFMNRVHNSGEALRSVKESQDRGLENISIDLIYGTPTMPDQNWKENLGIAFSLEVPHISSYCLTVEEKTPLANFVKTGKAKNVDEQQSAAQFEILTEEMKKNNFIQYEISNFCKEGFYSRHNSNYWLKENYLGLGPSAHSYNGSSRQWNISNNQIYIQSLEQNKLRFEKEMLTDTQRYNEYVMTSLRTIWGTNLEYIKNNLGATFLNSCMQEAKQYLDSGHLTESENKLFLTDKGKLLADKIASDLFVIDP